MLVFCHVRGDAQPWAAAAASPTGVALCCCRLLLCPRLPAQSRCCAACICSLLVSTSPELEEHIDRGLFNIVVGTAADLAPIWLRMGGEWMRLSLRGSRGLCATGRAASIAGVWPCTHLQSPGSAVVSDGCPAAKQQSPPSSYAYAVLPATLARRRAGWSGGAAAGRCGSRRAVWAGDPRLHAAAAGPRHSGGASLRWVLHATALFLWPLLPWKPLGLCAAEPTLPPLTASVIRPWPVGRRLPPEAEATPRSSLVLQALPVAGVVGCRCRRPDNLHSRGCCCCLVSLCALRRCFMRNNAKECKIMLHCLLLPLCSGACRRAS